MRKIIISAFLVISLLSCFASCTKGGNVASSNGQVSSAGNATSATTSNGAVSNGNGTTSVAGNNASSTTSGNIISDVGSGVSNVVSGVKSLT